MKARELESQRGYNPSAVYSKGSSSHSHNRSISNSQRSFRMTELLDVTGDGGVRKTILVKAPANAAKPLPTFCQVEGMSLMDLLGSTTDIQRLLTITTTPANNNNNNNNNNTIDIPEHELSSSFYAEYLLFGWLVCLAFGGEFCSSL